VCVRVRAVNTMNNVEPLSPNGEGPRLSWHAVRCGETTYVGTQRAVVELEAHVLECYTGGAELGGPQRV
jgi:hypothetical protein